MGSLEHNFVPAHSGRPNRLGDQARGHRDDLLRQAQVARTLGSPLVAAVLEAAHRRIEEAPRTARLLDGWPGDPAAAALAMRLCGALHAMARRGSPATLAALFRGEHRDYEGAVAEALRTGDAFIAEWMRHPTQTNEVGRAAALLAALMVAAGDLAHGQAMPFELLELGSSCGLNLNLTRYAHDLGGVRVGDRSSAVRIAPQWRGSPPPVAMVALAAARGVDLRPLDPADAATRERLLSFVWADQPGRAARLEQALAIARLHPPTVDRACAAAWLAERLAAPQAAGTCRAVMHSMVLQYLAPAQRAQVRGTIARAAAQATCDRPLARISFEWNPPRTEVRLLLTTWPGGETRHLASCHPYGDWIAWKLSPGG